MTPSALPRPTLRQLPLAAKLTLSCFLLAIGLGYFSALVQLHLQHSKKEGDPLPSPADVVEVFAGLKKSDPNCPPPGPPVSKLERLVTGAVQGAPFNGSGSMAPAFFHKDGGEYQQAITGDRRGGAAPRPKDVVDAERENERLVVQAWIKAKADVQGDAFRDDLLAVPEELLGKPLTAKYLTPNKDAVKVRSLLLDRCARCHAKGEAQESYPLQTYDHYLKYMDVPTVVYSAPAGMEWSDRQVSVEKLTQSTHAHLLSFAVMFMLTGLVFAFSGYHRLLRGVLAPAVLVAQVADVSCWWLARLPGVGQYFALAIVGTGAVVGLGLALQIVLGLLDMYGAKGKVVLILLFLLGGAAVGVVGYAVVKPALEIERKLSDNPKKSAANPVPGAQPDPPVKAATQQVVAPAPLSRIEQLVLGPVEADEKVPFNGKGTMAPAFFKKDGADYKDKAKAGGAAKAQLDAEREGERRAVVAWLHADPAARKRAYDDDRLPMTGELAGQAITPEYMSDGAVKVKSILTERCARCHTKDGTADKFPLETYDDLMKYVGKK